MCTTIDILSMLHKMIQDTWHGRYAPSLSISEPIETLSDLLIIFHIVFQTLYTETSIILLISWLNLFSCLAKHIKSCITFKFNFNLTFKRLQLTTYVIYKTETYTLDLYFQKISNLLVFLRPKNHFVKICFFFSVSLDFRQQYFPWKSWIIQRESEIPPSPLT